MNMVTQSVEKKIVRRTLPKFSTPKWNTSVPDTAQRPFISTIMCVRLINNVL